MFKTGNMTIALTNYVPGMATKDDGPVDGNWHVMAFLGSGKKYQVQPLCEENRKAAEKLMTTELGQDAALKITSSIRESIHAALAQVNTLDGSPYSFASRKGFVNPFEHIDNLAITIAGMTDKIVLLETPDSDVVNKSLIPLQQVCAVFALCETVKKLDPSAWKKEKGQRPGQGLVQQTPPIA